MSKFEVIRGVEGCCLALDDTRIAGPKPWGGGTVIHAWETDKEYKAVDTQSRWHELFGTPSRTARTLSRFCADCFCGDCAACGVPEWADYTRDYDALLEWLRNEDEVIDEPDTIRNELADDGLIADVLAPVCVDEKERRAFERGRVHERFAQQIFKEAGMRGGAE